MDNVFLLVFFAAAIALIIGMVRPGYVRATSRGQVARNFGLLALVGLGGVAATASPDGAQKGRAASNAAPVREEIGPDNASAACRAFVEKSLKEPSSAKFDYAGAESAKVDSVTWRSTGTVEAQNSFGALLRNPYACTLQYDVATDNWTALSVKLE